MFDQRSILWHRATMNVITLAQHKGGSGKTTAVVGLALAAKYARPNQQVVVVDLDRQRSATHWITEHKLPLELRHSVKDLPKGAFVVIDTPGLEPVLTAEGLRVADLVIVPLRASMLDWNVTRESTMKAVAGTNKPAAWLPSQVDLKRAADRALGTQTLPAAIAAGAAHDWPILPPVRTLATIADFLAGKAHNSAAADVFGELHRAVAKLLRRAGNA